MMIKKSWVQSSLGVFFGQCLNVGRIWQKKLNIIEKLSQADRVILVNFSMKMSCSGIGTDQNGMENCVKSSMYMLLHGIHYSYWTFCNIYQGADTIIHQINHHYISD